MFITYLLLRNFPFFYSQIYIFLLIFTMWKKEKKSLMGGSNDPFNKGHHTVIKRAYITWNTHSDTEEDKMSSFVLTHQISWTIKYQFLWEILSYFLGKELYTVIVFLSCILFSYLFLLIEQLLRPFPRTRWWSFCHELFL